MVYQITVAWTPFDPWHLLILGLVALLLFGKRLPDVGRSLGRGIMEFKKGLRDVQEELNREEQEQPRKKLHPPPEDERKSDVQRSREEFLSGEKVERSSDDEPPKS